MPQRKPIRLKNYDYSQAGYYFITICTENKKMQLWSETTMTMSNQPDSIVVGAIIDRPPISEIGQFIESALLNIETVYANVYLDEYIIMPNHIHFILAIDNCTNNKRSVDAPALSHIIQQFKGYVSKNCRHDGFHWQKSYYEHIIRNEQDLKKIREYIISNPAKWQDDEYYYSKI